MASEDDFRSRMAGIRARMGPVDGTMRLVTQVALDRAGVHVAELEPEEWVPQTEYFIQLVIALANERGAGGDAIEAFMRGLCVMVTERYIKGGW